jgi:putative flippase GtrA
MKNLATLRYLLVAGVCLLLHNGCVVAADALGARTAPAVVFSFAVVVVAGYLMHSVFTFGAVLDWTRFRSYVGGMAANIPIAFIGLWLLHDALGLKMAVASPLASGAMIVINYVLSRWALLIPSAPKELV